MSLKGKRFRIKDVRLFNVTELDGEPGGKGYTGCGHQGVIVGTACSSTLVSSTLISCEHNAHCAAARGGGQGV